jgi:hypothetical protein
MGNLLLTVSVTNPSDNALTLYLDQASMTAQTTDAYFGIANGGNTTGGLITGFTVAPAVATPEPGSLVLMLGAMVGLIAYRWRRLRLL